MRSHSTYLPLLLYFQPTEELNITPADKRTFDLLIGKNVDPEQTKLDEHFWKRYPYIFGNDDNQNAKMFVENIKNAEHPDETKLNDLHFPFHSLWKRYPYVFGIEPDNNLNFYNSPTKKMSNSKNYIPPQLRKYFNGFIRTV